jgi:hypothetical protein
MKNSFFFLLLLCISSCDTPKATFIQVYQTAAVAPIKTDKGHYVFENDTVRIDYGFWTERGVLAFKVENKLTIPLYIDWSRSSFIKNGEKLDFWIDEQKTNTSTYYQGYSVSANFWYQNGYNLSYGIPYTLGLTEGNAFSATTTIKPEKITFIAPQSYIIPAARTFHLFSVSGTKLRTDRDYSEVYTVNSNNEKVVKVKRYYADYDREESILKFRNFLTMSTSKDFTKEFYVDNSFYVSKVYEMRDGPFADTLKKPNSFYIHINEAISIEYRTKMDAENKK